MPTKTVQTMPPSLLASASLTGGAGECYNSLQILRAAYPPR